MMLNMGSDQKYFTMLDMRKLPRRSISLIDRASKSDVEDKSLSNDEIPMPSCPRQPPDGVETPSDAVEKIPDLPTRLPPRISSGWSSNRSRFSYSSRTQDARSEASVKDKIAMFSVDLATSSDRLDKCGTLPVRSQSTIRKSSTPYTGNYVEVSSLDRRLTKSTDNLDDTPRSYKRNIDRPEVLGALEIKNSEVISKRFNQSDMTNKPLFYGSTTTLPSDTTPMRPTYHMRSVSEDKSNKNSTHKSNLEYLIEQRKKSMSKLRGLIIPEMQVPIVDLPEIKVNDSLPKTFIHSSLNKETKKESKVTRSNTLQLTENKWKTNFLPNNIPKYSPAFKRKSLQVYTPSSLSKESTPERKFVEKMDTLSKVTNYNTSVTSKPSKSLFAYSKTAVSRCTPIYNSDIKRNGNLQDFKNVEIKICTTTDVIDSDNDSAMSSTQSSYRSSASSPMHIIDNNIESDNSRLSPRITHYNPYTIIKSETSNKSAIAERNNDNFIKRNVFRSVSSDTNISLSSSAGSAATSGSQASCSSLESSVADSDKRKVSKVYNVDNINRRNIVASAKCRSGRDVKLESPVIETKFSHESYNRSLSPTPKPELKSDRLSTLTPAVSAIAAKGENRRRNKVIVDTDSDSDTEINIRIRKPDYKNSRLKRNSSTCNKSKSIDVNKSNEGNQELEKVETMAPYKKDDKIKHISGPSLEIQDRINNSNTLAKNNGINLPIKNVHTEKQRDKINGLTSTESKMALVDSMSNIKLVSAVDNKSDLQIIKTLKNNVNCKETKNISSQIFRLKKGVGSGVGLILAGGVDCEAKDVTVHRVLEEGVAAKAGIKRGSKVIGINGNLMLGLTHAQSVSILKEQRTEVVIEIEKEVEENRSKTKCSSEHAESKGHQIDDAKYSKNNKKLSHSVVTVLLEKAGGGAGLGFGLDGGRDSPQGDRPLTIKKLFAGGAAAQSGRIIVGAELLSAGGHSMEGFTRTQAWAALKALPAGQVALVLRNP